MSTYDVFFTAERQSVIDSARAVTPLVMEWLEPRSVVDVGCGIGAWLAAFRALGVEQTLGLDGSWVHRGDLLIDPDSFCAVDLSAAFALERRFDLAISLEVAEHLPASSAEAFMDSLTALAPLVLFSAAIPGQRGPGHVNEQWPEYWARKFADRDFVALDCLRRRIWDDPRVAWYYAQNAVVYVRRDRLEDLRHPDLVAARHDAGRVLSLVHPRVFTGQGEDWRAWIERVQRVNESLSRHVPPGSALLLMDDEALGHLVGIGYAPAPIPDARKLRICPADDAQAARTLGQLLALPEQYVGLAWPVFWWLETYPALAHALSERARLVHRSEDLLIYASTGDANRASGRTQV